MIGAVLSWNGAGLQKIEAKRFASALRIGASVPISVERNGFVLACSNADQYFCGPAYQVLFYGHIDNRSKLRKFLGLQNATDAAIFSAAYHRWGDSTDKHVMGQYSTIVCDIAGIGIRVSRSPIKAPALYLSRLTDQIIIATTPKAIFATGRVERELDDQKIADSLILNYCEETRGWFRNVRRFRRAHFSWLTPDGERETCHWRIEDIPPVRYKRDSDYVEAADALFREAVGASLDGFSRPAISLSGGLDSQAVAAYTIAMRPDKPLLAYTSIPAFEGDFDTKTRFGNERPHVEALARKYPQLQTNWVTCGGLDMSHHLDDVFAEAQVPPRNAMNLYWIHDILKSAKSAGADVLLNGAMGNLTFSYDGTGVIPILLKRGQFKALLREVNTGGISILKAAVRPLLPKVAVEFYRFIRGTRRPAIGIPWSPIHPDFARDMRVMKRAEELGYDPSYARANSPESYRQLLLSNAINEAGDISYALDRIHELPTRDPTAFLPLLEYCFAIPPEQYLHKGEERWLARRLLVGKIPEVVLNERRRGRQAADGTLRIQRKKDELLEEINWLMSDDSVSAKIDLKYLQSNLEKSIGADMQTEGALSGNVTLALTRGIATARFLRYNSKKNS